MTHPVLRLPPSIKVRICKNYKRVFQLIDPRLPRVLHYIVSFGRLGIANTAAILTTRNGCHQHDWSNEDLKKLEALRNIQIHNDNRVFLYDIDRSVDYDYINWKLAGEPYVKHAFQTERTHSTEENLLELRSVLETEGSVPALDTFNRLFSEQLTEYKEYLKLVQTCDVLTVDDIHQCREPELSL